MLVVAQVTDQTIIHIQYSDSPIEFRNDQPFLIGYENVRAGQKVFSKGPEMLALRVIDLDAVVPPVGNIEFHRSLAAIKPDAVWAVEPATALSAVQHRQIIACCVVAADTVASVAISNPYISVASTTRLVDGHPCWNVWLVGSISRCRDLSDDLPIGSRFLYYGAFLIGQPEKLLTPLLDQCEAMAPTVSSMGALAGALTDCSVDATAKGFYFGVSSGCLLLGTFSLAHRQRVSRTVSEAICRPA